MSTTATLPDAPAFEQTAEISSDPGKQALRKILDELPDGLGIHDLARQLELVAGVREAIEQADRGEGIPIDQVKKEIASWFTK